MNAHRIVAVRSLFGALAMGAAAAGGILAYGRTSSWWLVAFVVMMALYGFGRLLPDLLTDPEKGRRAVFFGLPLAMAVGGVALAYWGLGAWWSAVLVGFGAGAVGWGVVTVAFPDIAAQEQEDSLARVSGGAVELPPASPALEELFRAVHEAGIPLSSEEKLLVARAYAAGDYDAVARLVESMANRVPARI